MQPGETTINQFQSSLLAWYAAHRRDLPWRKTRDPYAIWVSEVMLQQTQADVVTSYYLRFIRRFPTVNELAEAEPGEVMKMWEGLGYYGRARHLHNAAKEVANRFGGHVPCDATLFRSLPGVGAYTAGAVLSIACGLPVPAVDGNVMRVLSRVFHVTENVQQVRTKKHLTDLAESLLPLEQPGDFNQALMELGALVCIPRNPLCQDCPLTVLCEAKKLGIQNALPVRSPRKPVPHYDVTAGVIWRDDTFLITLRPPRGLLGGLWEFPGGKCEPDEDLTHCIVREIQEELAIQVAVNSAIISVDHAYTHFKITLHAFHCRFLGGNIRPIACDDYRWITASELDAFAFPSADRKIIDHLKQNGGFQ